jgi:hypothetical protein
MLCDFDSIDREIRRCCRPVKRVFRRPPVFASPYLVSLFSESVFVTEVPFLAAEQLAWQAQELGVLIHFNMATFIDSDGCSAQAVPNISLFTPDQLNTDNWVQTMLDYGAQYAVLVAKVRCILRRTRDEQ